MTAETPQRPRLAVLCDALAEKQDQIAEASALYSQLKAVLNSGELPADGLSFAMHICGMQVPIAAPADQATTMAHIESATSLAGDQVVRLWGEAHGITADAVNVCNAAAQQAHDQQQAAAPQPPDANQVGAQ